VNVKNLSSLTYAHYPLRGVYQAMSKIILSEISLSMKPDRGKGEGFQFTKNLELIKRRGELTEDDVKRLSAEYAVHPERFTEPVQLVEEHLAISFAGDKLRLRYTDYAHDRNNFFRVVFSQIDEDIKQQTEKLRKKGKKLEDKFRKFRKWLLSILRR
jgi:hypothetical protein